MKIKADFVGTQKAMEGAPVDWEAIADECSENGTLHVVANEIESMAQWLARCAGYFHARELGQSHRQAVNRSNTTVAAIRRPLGFTYARNDIRF